MLETNNANYTLQNRINRETNQFICYKMGKKIKKTKQNFGKNTLMLLL